MERLLQLTDPTDPLDADAVLLAARYVQEWRLHRWGHALNVNEGVSARTKFVLEACEAYRARCSAGAQPPERGDVSSGASRMWASRWRRRRGGGYGRLRVRNEPPLAEMRAKASFCLAGFGRQGSAPQHPRPTHLRWASVSAGIRGAEPQTRPQRGPGMRIFVAQACAKAGLDLVRFGAQGR